MKRKKNLIPNREVDVRPLVDRETKLNVRKGMRRLRCFGFFDASEYVQNKINEFFTDQN